jgi:hypothetical protein
MSNSAGLDCARCVSLNDRYADGVLVADDGTEQLVLISYATAAATTTKTGTRAATGGAPATTETHCGTTPSASDHTSPRATVPSATVTNTTVSCALSLIPGVGSVPKRGTPKNTFPPNGMYPP